MDCISVNFQVWGSSASILRAYLAAREHYRTPSQSKVSDGRLIENHITVSDSGQPINNLPK